MSEGRLFTRRGFAWACPECGAVLAESRCRESRDRTALAHCLLHRSYEAAGRAVSPAPFSRSS